METIFTKKAPAAIGPYSQAIKVGNILYLSGQIPINPETGAVRAETIKEATNQIFDNIEAVLAEAGATLKDVVKTTVFLLHMDDFNEMNATYAGRFDDHHPARSTVQVGRLPKDVPVEIEVIAVLSEK